MQQHPLPTRVRDALMACVSPGSSLCVAVSGGSDSTALLLLLAQVQKQTGIARLAVAHVNHGLRGEESDEDERFVRVLAANLGIPFFAKRLSGKTIASAGMEAWAREARYAFFMELMRRERFDAVATGHTADDQAETVLLRIARGAGLRGLRGILPSRGDGVIRPLIGCGRAELAAWLEANSYSYRTDSSNAHLVCRRNEIRLRILPRFVARDPRARDTLIAIAAVAQEIWNRMAPSVDRWITTFATPMEKSFQVAKKGLDDPIHAPEAILTLLERYGIEASSNHIGRILACRNRTSGMFLLPGGQWRYCPTRETIEFFAAPADAMPDFEIELQVPGRTAPEFPRISFDVVEIAPPFTAIPRDNRTVFLDRAACGNRLRCRPLRPDDRFIPMGRSTPVSLSEFLAKQGFNALERQKCVIVTGESGEIIWIPGVRIAHSAQITPKTRSALKISYHDCPGMI